MTLVTWPDHPRPYPTAIRIGEPKKCCAAKKSVARIEKCGAIINVQSECHSQVLSSAIKRCIAPIVTSGFPDVAEGYC
jgi:hypothetical protein